MDFNVAVAIPSYKREQWLYDHFIDNMYDKLLSPLNNRISDRGLFEFHIYVQGTSEEWKTKLQLKVKDKKYFKLNFTDITVGTKMTELRCKISKDIIDKDSSITHIMMSDDDLGIMSNDRLIDHYEKLLCSKDFINQSTIYMGKPSSVYRTAKFQTNGPYIRGHFDNNYLNLIRFQAYPTKYFKSFFESEWNETQKLYQIDNGEDHIISVLIFVAMSIDLSKDAKFQNVFGFDELYHFANTMNRIDVLSTKFKEENRSLDPQYYIEAKKFIDDISSRYNFKLTGYDRSKRNINTRKIFFDLYPELYNSSGLLNIRANSISKFVNKYDPSSASNSLKPTVSRSDKASLRGQPNKNKMPLHYMRERNKNQNVRPSSPSRSRPNIVKQKLPAPKPHTATVSYKPYLKPEEITSYTGTDFHVTNVIPSYKREDWLAIFIPNMYNKLLKPINDMISGKFTYTIYVQDATPDKKSMLVKLNRQYDDLVNLEFVDKSKFGSTITELRYKFAEDVIQKDSTISHVMMTDDDLYIDVDDSSRLIKDFTDMFNLPQFKDSLLYSLPCYKNGIIPDSLAIRETDYTDPIWLIRFQIIPRKTLYEFFSTTFYDYTKLFPLTGGEDYTLMTLPNVINPNFYTLYGFTDLLHIGGEHHANLHKSYRDKMVPRVQKLNLGFDFGTTGFSFNGRPSWKDSRIMMIDNFPGLHRSSLLVTGNEMIMKLQKIRSGAVRIHIDVDNSRQIGNYRHRMVRPPNNQNNSIVSLGNSCQVGVALSKYRLRHTDSIFDHMYIYNWRTIVNLMENDFNDFFEFENLRISDIKKDVWNVFKGKSMDMYNVYDKKYNCMSEHYYEVTDDLMTLDVNQSHRLKERMNKKANEIRSAIKNPNRTTFICKLMDDDIITVDEVNEFVTALINYKGNDNIELRLIVNPKCSDVLNHTFNHVKVYQYSQKWADNGEPKHEWDSIFTGLQKITTNKYNHNRRTNNYRRLNG